MKPVTEKNTTLWTKTPFIILIATFCCALWGSAFPLIKIGYNLFSIPSESAPVQILFAGIRFTLAGIMVILTGSLIEHKFLLPKPESILKILLLSSLQTVGQYIFFYIGLAHTSGVNASIIEATNTFFVILWATLIFRTEKITFWKIAGCTIGFAGVCLIELHGFDFKNFSFSFTGDGFILISSLLSSFVPSLLKRFSKTEKPFVLSGYQFLFGGIIMMLAALPFGAKIPSPAAPVKAYILLTYLAFISACAYTLWALLMQKNDVSRVAIFGFINPVFGFLLSALLLHEAGSAFSWTGICSLLMVCAGIVLVYAKKR